jgi:propionate CoA-transferase
MKLFERIKLLLHVLRWRLSWSKRNLDYLPTGLSSNKFITARQAAILIPDGACVISNGFAGCARSSVFFWAIREVFLKSGHPRALTWINVGGQGGRGKVPGTVEELGLPGLMDKYITGHLETTKAQLRLAEAGQLELYTMPQGVMTMLLDAQAKGETNCNSEVGLGTFLDPRVGLGTRVTTSGKDQFVSVNGAYLNYALPKIDHALFNAPYADVEGNIYFKHAATVSENIPTAKAARANGGRVLVTVSGLIPKDEPSISMRADEVDYIVVHPYNEQIVSIPQKKYWPMFTPEQNVDLKQAIQRLNFINKVLKITPVRSEVDYAVARLAASFFVESVPKGGMANIGVGYPEELVKNLVEHGLEKDILFTTEVGSYGGVPTSGIFFGATLNPQKLISSLEMFKLYQKELDVAVLGFLQVDSAGNVNSSKRGPKLTDFVGPGGFPDIIDGAKTVIFIGSWMAKADFQLENGQIKILRAGNPKFVQQVDQITFSAAEGLRKGKQVYYVTHVGVFKLTDQGLQLIQVMPGIDIQKDIIEGCTAQFQIPDQKDIGVADASVISGEGFYLEWQSHMESSFG